MAKSLDDFKEEIKELSRDLGTKTKKINPPDNEVSNHEIMFDDYMNKLEESGKEVLC